MHISTDQTNLILDSIRTEIMRCKSMGSKTRVQKLQQLLDDIEQECIDIRKKQENN